MDRLLCIKAALAGLVVCRAASFVFTMCNMNSVCVELLLTKACIQVELSTLTMAEFIEWDYRSLCVVIQWPMLKCFIKAFKAFPYSPLL